VQGVWGRPAALTWRLRAPRPLAQALPLPHALPEQQWWKFPAAGAAVTTCPERLRHTVSATDGAGLWSGTLAAEAVWPGIAVRGSRSITPSTAGLGSGMGAHRQA